MKASSAILIILLFANSLFASSEPRQIGNVIFANGRGEIMIYSNVENPSLIISKNSIVSVKYEKSLLKFTVVEICEKCISAKAIDDKGNLSNLENSPVFFFDNDNSSLRYGDAKKVLNSLIKIYENFIFSIESTEEASIIAATIDTFSTDIENLLPEMERVNKKYPELKNFYSSPPDELKYEAETLKALEPSLNNAFFKMNLYSQNSSVQKSMERLGKVLERLKNAGK